MEQELNRKQLRFHKNDNAFLAVDNVAELQAAADRLNPEIIRKQLDYWTFLLGPKFSKKERSQMNLSRFYAIAQIEYCRNFIFKRHFPIHKIFERGCEILRNRLFGADGAPHQRDLRGAAEQAAARQTCDRDRPDRASPSWFPRLLEKWL